MDIIDGTGKTDKSKKVKGWIDRIGVMAKQTDGCMDGWINGIRFVRWSGWMGLNW